MEYRHLGYFLAACVVVLGSLLGWLIRMFFVEKKVIGRLMYLQSKSNSENSSE